MKQPTTFELAVPHVLQPIWGKRPSETPYQYIAFELYRDMGLYRSHRKVSTELGHKSTKVVERWAVKNDWTARSREYDEYVETVRMQEFHKQRLESIRRQADLGARLQNTAIAALDHIDVEKINAGEIARIAEVGVKIERLAFGDTTEETANNQTIQFVVGELPPWAAGAQQKKVDADASRSTPANPDARALSARLQTQLAEDTHANIPA